MIFWLKASMKCFSYPADDGKLPPYPFGITLEVPRLALGFLGTVFGVG